MTANKKSVPGEIERKVLETYQRVNPSFAPEAHEKESFIKFATDRERLFHDVLKFPPKLFSDCSLIDFGAGTGEKTLCYAVWGARCTLVDFNDAAISQAEGLFEKHRQDPNRHSFQVSYLSEFGCEEKFDIVVSEGVIHHTENVRKSFDGITGFAKPGGYIILGVGNKSAAFQRQAQRAVVFRFAQSVSEIEAVAEDFFPDHLDRAQEFGHRPREAIIHDTYVNPKVDFVSVADVLGWFSHHGIRLYSSWPVIELPLFADSAARRTCQATDIADIGTLTEIAMLTHDEDDQAAVPQMLESFAPLSEANNSLVDQLNDCSQGDELNYNDIRASISEYLDVIQSVNPLDRLFRKTQILLLELLELMELLDAGDKPRVRAFIKNTDLLFRGTAGSGLTYFVGRKVR